MNHRLLRYVVALAEELNFTRAAARCNVSQPPFSRSIALFETQLGVRLFERDRHSVNLTDAGRQLYHDARKLLAMTDEAVERARRTACGLRGTLTLGFGGTSSYAFWPRLVRAFNDAVPDVRIVFRSMPVLEQIDAIREGTIDLGLVRLPIMDELISTQHAYSEPLIVALPDRHPLLARPGPIDLRDLAGADFVTYEPRRGFNYHVDLQTLCRLAGFKPTIAHEGHSTEAIIGMVACGQGAAIMPRSAARLRVHGTVFRALDAREAPAELALVTFGLAWRADSPSPVTLEFLEHARAVSDDPEKITASPDADICFD